MTVSMVHIKEKSRRKTNPSLVATLLAARKQKAWLALAHRLSGPTRLHAALNLDQIDKQTTAGDTIVIPGKVLASGTLSKKLRICALSISTSARDKLKSTKSEYVSIFEEIAKNPKAQGVKML
ncbi:50S ribosomal protein L18e [Candidatus Pacearchaeota archaeon]|nr:50S ribosomal protein L18e [Candidatus Pacearchaeota archaeon]